MQIFNQNLVYASSFTEETTNLEAVNHDSVTSPDLMAAGCFGSFGTLGSVCGCAGSFGTYGCGSAETV